MGTDIRNELNIYVASLDVDLSKAGVVIRRTVERLLGAHNLCHYRLSVSDRETREGRQYFAVKDRKGDQITKYVLKKLTITMRSTIKRTELETEMADRQHFESRLRAYGDLLAEAPSTMQWIVTQANQLGLDYRKKDGSIVEHKSFYWTVLDNARETPNDTWTIFEECRLVTKGQMAKYNQRRDRSTNLAKIYERMYQLKEQFDCLADDESKETFKSKYDAFGHVI